MIISYDKNSSLSVDEKLKSLVDNIQIALDETPGSTAQSIDEAKIMAERAHSAAAEAAETAGTAQTTAESAQSAAESAQSAAGNASNAATEAQSKAEAAQSAASTASSTATEAKTTAESAQTTASTASITATEAKSTAEAAQTAAGNAQSTAESASSTATEAKSTAESAQSTASTAQSTAENAQSAASTAQSTAEAAGKTATDYIKENADGTINIENKSTTSTAKAVVNESSFDIVDEGETVASFGEVSRIGTGSKRHIEMESNGFKVLNGDSVIAHIGYGEVADTIGTSIGAFYAFGKRKEGEPIGNWSHAEGFNSTASGSSSHAEGNDTTASGWNSHAEGFNSTASGEASHAQNIGTKTIGRAQTAIGKYNTWRADDTAFIIGNGSSIENRSDALRVDFDGTLTLAGHSSAIGSAATPYNGSANNGNTVSTTGSWQSLKSSVTLDKGTWIVTASARFKDSATVGGSTANTTAGNRFLAITVGGSRHDASVTGGYIAAKQAARYSTSLAVVIDEDGTAVSMAVNTSTAVGIDMQNIEAVRIA